MDEVDAPAGLRCGRAVPPQALVVGGARRDHLHAGRRRHAAEGCAVGQVHLPLEIVGAQRRRRHDVEGERHVGVRRHGCRQGNRTHAPGRVGWASRRPQGVAVGGLPRRRGRVGERLGDQDRGPGWHRRRNLLRHELRRGRYHDARGRRLLAEGPVRLREHAKHERRGRREAAGERLDHKIERDLLPRSHVVGQQNAVAAVHAVRIVLNAPVIIVLRLLRRQKHVAADPGCRARVLHRHRGRCGSLKLDEGWHRFRYVRRRIGGLRVHCRGERARHERHSVPMSRCRKREDRC